MTSFPLLHGPAEENPRHSENQFEGAEVNLPQPTAICSPGENIGATEATIGFYGQVHSLAFPPNARIDAKPSGLSAPLVRL